MFTVNLNTEEIGGCECCKVESPRIKCPQRKLAMVRLSKSRITDLQGIGGHIR